MILRQQLSQAPDEKVVIWPLIMLGRSDLD